MAGEVLSAKDEALSAKDEALSVTDEGHWAVEAQTVPENSATADKSEQPVP